MKKITVVDTDTAELHYLLPVKSNLKKTYPENKIFIKVFINFFDILPTLNKSELMFISLICKNIKPNKNTVAIQLHKHFSKSKSTNWDVTEDTSD